MTIETNNYKFTSSEITKVESGVNKNIQNTFFTNINNYTSQLTPFSNLGPCKATWNTKIF